MPTVSEAFQAIPGLVRHDKALLHRLRHFSGQFSVTAGDERWFLPFEKGQPGEAILAGTVLQSAAVAFNAAPEVWLSHWRPVPPPPDHDLFGLAKSKKMRIDGDMAVYMQQLQNIKDVLAKPRALFA